MAMTVDWAEALDFQRALVNCHEDMLGDWYRDPWGWPETDWAVKKQPKVLIARLNAAGVQQSARLDVPKEGFATRPAIVMDPIDRIVYQALVDRISVDLIGDMRPWVFGWRLPRTDPDRGRYSNNGNEWEWYRNKMSFLANFNSFALATDVVSFFANVPIDRMCEEILSRTGTGLPQTRLIDMLQAWARMQGRCGLPQRSKASAVLANMYLRPVDDVLDAAATETTFLGIKAKSTTRWMDDIWLFGRDEGRLRRAQLTLDDVMRDLDLNMNTAKTHVYGGDDVVRVALEMEHSAAEEGLDQSPVDPTALQVLIDKLIANPEASSRTSLKFAIKRVRTYELEAMVQQFVDKAERMPHGADALSRMLGESDRWRDLEDWYVAYASSSWAAFDWSTGQLGTMFPSSQPGKGAVRQYMLETLVRLPPLQSLSVAAQRSVSWDRDRARQAIREAAKNANHPLQRRALALAALGAGEERPFVRSLLSEFEQNDATLRMIEDRRFRPVPVKPDFA
jgi:hypothetical protein